MGFRWQDAEGPPQTDRHTGYRKLGAGENKSSCTHFPDLIHLIRSIQRIEGHPDCFAAAGESCGERKEKCPWRTMCLRETQKAGTHPKGKDRRR